MQDERTSFTVEEYMMGLSLVLPATEVEAAVARLLAPLANDGRSPIQLSEDVLDCLSLVSDAAAERVRSILGLSTDAAARRRTRFRERIEGSGRSDPGEPE